MRLNDILSLLKKISPKEEYEFFIVGGAVRDMLLGYEDVCNIDITVTGNFEGFVSELTKILGIDRSNVKESLFMTATVEYEGLSIDVVTARKENYEKPGMLPAVTPSDLSDDLRRRDFTLNSIAYDIRTERMIDVLNGICDLENRVLRANRENLFEEDPTRLFRFVKYRTRFGFTTEKSTKEQMIKSLSNKNLFKNVSKSRISKEWLLSLKENDSDKLIENISNENVFSNIFKTNVICNPRFEKTDEAFFRTVATFYDNDLELLIEIADTLLNGLKKNKIKSIEEAKRESKEFRSELFTSV
ncbi:MAG: hypothetical protein PHW02_04770 [bacterium]|nr:hypothetical protein [bacterium]